jgi:hypothetical protein
MTSTLSESTSVDAGVQERLNSATAGVLVKRVGQLRAAHRTRGRQALTALSDHINEAYAGLLSATVHEEPFGVRDRLHWVISLSSLEAYDTYRAMEQEDPRWQEIRDTYAVEAGPEGTSSLENLFVDGSLVDTMLLPQSFGMYGTANTQPSTVVMVGGEAVERFVVPCAVEQTEQANYLHTGNAGLVMHRTGQLVHENRMEGRAFARQLAEGWNASLEGVATIFLYEEVFGQSDRIHWLIHLKHMSTYYNLMGFRARIDAAARELFTRQWVPAERGGGGWERLFVQSSLTDLALVPTPR